MSQSIAVDEHYMSTDDKEVSTQGEQTQTSSAPEPDSGSEESRYAPAFFFQEVSRQPH